MRIIPKSGRSVYQIIAYQIIAVVIIGIVACIPTLPSLAADISSAGDVNHDGAVNGADISLLLSDYSKDTGAAINPSGDLNGDHVINGADLSAAVGNYGTQGSASTNNKLMYERPSLTDPIILAPTAATTDQTLTMDTTKDYIIHMPAQATSSIILRGGRNVVMIGGRIHVTNTTVTKRGIYVWGATGTVHIEGVMIDQDADTEADGIAINAPDAVVNVENCRIVGLLGSQPQPHNHSDVIQPWGGVAGLNVYKLTGSSNYQGLFLRPDLGALGPLNFDKVNIGYDNVGAAGGGYLLWLTTGGDSGVDNATTASAVNFGSEVYLGPLRPANGFGKSVWPDINNAFDAPTIINNYATWPGLSAVSGGVHSGTPPSGDYVPDGAAGATYVSPGYQ